MFSSSGCGSVYSYSPAGAPSHFGTYCSTFRMTPCTSSWVPPLVAPSGTSLVAEPSGYIFVSRAPVVRHPPPTSEKASVIKRSRSRPHIANQKLFNPSANRRPSMSSHCLLIGTVPEQAEPGYQYNEFLASFQRRIDGMTGQSGG
jgi:hypothetical protein